MASTDAAMAAGNEAFLELEFDEAIKQYSKAAEAGVPAAFGRRGAVFLAMKKHQEAMYVAALIFFHVVRHISVCTAPI